MNQSHDPAEQSLARVRELMRMAPHQFELWKYYEDRADRLGERLWTTGIWLMAIIASILSLPFVAGFIKPSSGSAPIQIVSKTPVVILAIFGALFCYYAFQVACDIRAHIESNWRKAGHVLDGGWETNWGGRKGHGWNVLIVVGFMAFAAFVALLGLTVMDLLS